MSEPDIRPADEADLPFITAIYAHAVRFGTATFELVPPDLAEMTGRYRALINGGVRRMRVCTRCLRSNKIVKAA